MAKERVQRADGTFLEIDIPEPDDGDKGGNAGGRDDAAWREMRKKAEKADELQKLIDTTNRERAFEKAGLDPAKDPRLAYFIKGYDGEATPEKILEAATAAGFVAAEGAPAGPNAQQQQSLGDAQKIAQAAIGGNQNPVTGQAALDDAYSKGGLDGLWREAERQGLMVVRDNDGV